MEELAEDIEFEKEENPEEDNFYSEKVIDRLLEDDELSAGEEGFMIGYMEA